MKRGKLSQALFGSAMALVVSSSAYARPMVLEPHDNDATFSVRAGKAAPGLGAVSSRGLDLPVASTTRGGPWLLGAPSADSDNALAFGNLNPHAISDDHSQGHSYGDSHGDPYGHSQGHPHDPGVPVSDKTFDVSGQQDLATVSAVPEPSTYALLALGLAGIAGMARRRRR